MADAHPEPMIPRDQVTLPEGGLWSRLPLVAGGIGGAALALALALGRSRLDELLHAYLFAFFYFLTLALGGLFFVLLHHATRAGWSVVVRRLAEHVAGTLPLFALAFLPIALGIHHLYPWSDPEVMAHDALLQKKAAYLNVPFFYLRAALVLGCWAGLGWWWRRQSLAQDESGGESIPARLRRWSPLGLIIFGLTLTVAAFDWLMTLDPHWYSTIFGVYIFAGALVGIFALLVLLALRLESSGQLRGFVTFEHFHDLGKLLFAFTVFWAYIAFSQFMLIWYANIPEETVFFAHRWEHGWKPISIFLAAGHFGLPFFFLLLRDVKRRRATLIAASLWLLAMHAVDLFWLVMPSAREHFHVDILDALCWVGIGGLFLATLAALARRSALLPLHDPRLAESLSFESV